MACFYCARTGERKCDGHCGLGCFDCPGDRPADQTVYNERYGYGKDASEDAQET